MAVKVALATGNFLTAGTWGIIDATSYVNSETTTTALTTSYQANTGVTTGVITIRGILMKLSVRTGTTGTMSVHLAIAGVEVTGTLVTINTADLPAAATADINGGWIYFKFAGDVVLVGATSYTVEAKTSSSSQVSLFSVSGSNWAVAYQTTTTGAPAAGDDLIITGIHTTTGAPAAVTVTMNETAATDYGAASTSLVTPSLAVGNSGALTYGTTAATNYYLRQSGNVIIYSGGTLNMGTTGTKIPRDSSAKLNFDCAANVDFGLTVRALGTFVAQGLSRTSGKDIVKCLLNTDEAANSTSLGVDTDTGWLDNDEIAVASTTRTASDCEKGTLNGAAGASTLTVDGFGGVGGGLLVAHSGTSPTQAEVVLLTHNVQIFGASASLQSFIDIRTTATVDCDWTEFYNLGSATTNKRGIDIGTTTGSASFIFCSIHNCEVASSVGFLLNRTDINNVTVQNCATFKIANIHLQTSAIGGTTGTTLTFDANIFMYSTDSGSTIFQGNDLGGVITNNTIVGMNGTGFFINEPQGVVGTFSGNTVHSGGTSNGFFISGANVPRSSTFTNTVVWRINSTGATIAGPNNIYDGLTIFGCSGSSITFSGNCNNSLFLNFVSNGDTTFSTTNGINPPGGSNNGMYNIVFENSDLSTVAGIKTAHTNDINCGSNTYCRMIFRNSKFGAATELTNQSNMITDSFISSQKHDQTAGTHKTWMPVGTLQNENTTFKTAAPSVSMTPTSASVKLTTGVPNLGKKYAVANGGTVTPTVWVRKNASYNGNAPRLVVRKNVAAGISADTVLDTLTVGADTWEQLTGATASVTDDAVLEFFVDCDGTAGVAYVDDWA